jgi:hypothetical protein
VNDQICLSALCEERKKERKKTQLRNCLLIPARERAQGENKNMKQQKLKKCFFLS